MSTEQTPNPPAIEDIREAVANYMSSEGCSCCRNIRKHEEHTKRLAELLDVKPSKLYDTNRIQTRKIRIKELERSIEILERESLTT